MKLLIITNNSRVNEAISYNGESCFRNIDVDFDPDMSQMDVLVRARDMIHLGAKLVMHPMMGRIKPHETPYKSVFLEVPEEREREKGTECDLNSVIMIEDSMAETAKLLQNTFALKYDDSMLPDLQYLDYLLLKAGAEEYRR